LRRRKTCQVWCIVGAGMRFVGAGMRFVGAGVRFVGADVRFVGAGVRFLGAGARFECAGAEIPGFMPRITRICTNFQAFASVRVNSWQKNSRAWRAREF